MFRKRRHVKDKLNELEEETILSSKWYGRKRNINVLFLL